MIYLDHAATTPLDPQVVDVMVDYLKNEYGNPSSKFYPQAERAKISLAKSREQVASLINSETDEIIFTSGASESNNMVLKGIADADPTQKVHIVTTAIEHKAILETCSFLETKGHEVTYLPVDSKGHISHDDLIKSIKCNTKLVSIMWGNNEIGTLNDIDSISKICAEKNVPLHVDATQVVGKIEVDLKTVAMDYMSLSAHKLYGPKGVGALYIKRDQYGLLPEIAPLIHGGSQEYELRAGTHSMHNIVGFGKACEVAQQEMHEYIPRILELEKEFLKELHTKIPTAVINGDLENKIPGLLSISIPGLKNEVFLKMYSDEFALSSGSACGLGEPSHILSAISTSEITVNTIRLTIGKTSHTSLQSLIVKLSNF